MCGPTLVVHRNQRTGDKVYCHNCGGEVVVDRTGAHITVRPAGRMGSPGDLEPEADLDIIGELVRAAGAYMAPLTD